MDTLELLREKLRDVSKADISRETGLHYNTVRKFFKRGGSKPNYATVEKIQQYAQEKG